MIITACAVGRTQVSDSTLAAQLKQVKRFAFGPVGDTPHISQAETLFKAVLALPRERAEQLFQEVLADGNPQAKAFALTGLHKLSPQEFTALRATWGTSELDVKVQEGCIVTHRKLGELVQEIAAGEYDGRIK